MHPLEGTQLPPPPPSLLLLPSPSSPALTLCPVWAACSLSRNMMNRSALWEFLLAASQRQLHLCLWAGAGCSSCGGSGSAAGTWLGQPVSDILLQLDWEEAALVIQLCSHSQGNFSPPLSSPFFLLLLQLEDTSLIWILDGCSGWADAEMTETWRPPLLLPLLVLCLLCAPLWHARVKPAGFLLHHSPPSNRVMILIPLSAALDPKASRAKQRD